MIDRNREGRALTGRMVGIRISGWSMAGRSFMWGVYRVSSAEAILADGTKAEVRAMFP
jgi:hypothetical protein